MPTEIDSDHKQEQLELVTGAIQVKPHCPNTRAAANDVGDSGQAAYLTASLIKKDPGRNQPAIPPLA